MLHAAGSSFQKALKREKNIEAKESKPGEEKSAIVTRTSSRSTELYFLFKGVQHKFMMSPLSFLTKSGLMDRNLVMLRDSACSLYHGAISEELCDFELILKRLQDYKQQYADCTSIHCSGTSAGAYAAILFGYYLKADTVTAFAPPSLINEEEVRLKYSLPESWKLPDKHRDLALLLSNCNGRTVYRLYYCQNCLRDRESAERLARFSGVSLHPQTGHIHNVVEVLDELGQLENIFQPSCMHDEAAL